MPSIPHSFTTAFSAYAAPLAALLISLALPLIARGKAWAAAAGPLALFAGWALLRPVALLPREIWAPHRGTETLLAPAVACVGGVLIVAWRGGQRKRLVAFLVAIFSGWWVARDGVGPGDFWRVWFGIGAFAWVLSRVMQGRADRLLVLAVALWGGLVVAGAGQGWLMAALIAASCAVGLVASGAQAAVPAAAIAALMGATDLADGRLLRGRLDAADFACLAALAAPLVSDAAAKRIGRLSGPISAVTARAIGVGAAVGAVWAVRRAFLT